MGELHAARADTAALATIANTFDDAADLIGRAARTRLVFDGASAGRAHTGAGGEVRRALEALLADLDLWARAAAEIAVALRTGADRYRGADTSAAAGIG
jgi:hypothetical protein